MRIPEPPIVPVWRSVGYHLPDLAVPQTAAAQLPAARADERLPARYQGGPAYGPSATIRRCEPRCYLAVEDTLRRRNVLLLEDLSATAEFRTVVDAVTVAEAEAVVDALAGLHARFWNTDRFDGDLWELAQRSPAEIRLGDLIRRKFIGTITGHTAGIIPMTRSATAGSSNAAPISTRSGRPQPRTLIHGDTHLGNLFF